VLRLGVSYKLQKQDSMHSSVQEGVQMLGNRFLLSPEDIRRHNPELLADVFLHHLPGLVSFHLCLPIQ